MSGLRLSGLRCHFSSRVLSYVAGTSSLQLHAELLFFWQVCSAIPCGKVSTYGALAKALRSSPRAVGQARQRLVLPVKASRQPH